MHLRGANRRVLSALLPLVLLVPACSGNGKKAESSGTSTSVATGQSTTTAGPTTTQAASGGDATTLPPGAQAGLDDYDGDGQPDPTCSTQDFGAGLVLRIPCTIGNAHEPEAGTVLTKDSLYRLPGNNPDTFEGVSGGLLEARDQAGVAVRIIVFNTDGLFSTGSSTIEHPEQMDAVVRAITRTYPGTVTSIQVRGHTDSTGAAAANQKLSEQRAAAVKDQLAAKGLTAPMTTAGLASAQPLAEEKKADGSVSVEGQRFNRRVEIVIRLKSTTPG